MHILYVDESGTEQATGSDEHFVLLGVAIRGDLWKDQDAALEALKDRYGLGGVEIHTAWMARRYVEQDRVPGFEKLDREQRRTAAERESARRAGELSVRGRRAKLKAYRVEAAKIRPYFHLTRSERRACLLELARLLGTFGTVRIFGESVKKDAFPAAGKATPYEQAFEQVMTRYQAYLARASDIGIVVHDQNATVAPRLLGLMRKFHREGTLFRSIDNIVETPLFVDSAMTSMIQMADLGAYALRRFIEKGERDLWGALRERVDQVNGLHVGVRHYTGKQECACEICVAHGRKTQQGHGA